MTRIEADSRLFVIRNAHPDSIRRSSHDVAADRVTSRACCRDQSIPSTSAANCADVSRITPSVTGGHRNAPCSSCFQNSTRPEPYQTEIFTRSVRFERNTKIVPENGSSPSVLLTRATSPSALRKSIGLVATHDRHKHRRLGGRKNQTASPCRLAPPKQVLGRDVVPSRHFRHDRPRLIGLGDHLALGLVAPPAPTANPGANINAPASLRSVNYMVDHLCEPIHQDGYVFQIRSNVARSGRAPLTNEREASRNENLNRYRAGGGVYRTR
jgi:hypothetical protein